MLPVGYWVELLLRTFLCTFQPLLRGAGWLSLQSTLELLTLFFGLSLCDRWEYVVPYILGLMSHTLIFKDLLHSAWRWRPWHGPIGGVLGPGFGMALKTENQRLAPHSVLLIQDFRCQWIPSHVVCLRVIDEQ